jgi:hypothetical protein
VKAHLPSPALAGAKAAAALDDAVRRARLDGATWEQVGDAADMTKQAAHGRWRPAERRNLSGLRVSEVTDDEVRRPAGSGPEDPRGTTASRSPSSTT